MSEQYHRPDKATRIDLDGNGNLDDVALHDVSLFHLEYMDDKTVWIRCDRKDGEAVVIWLKANGKIKGRWEYD